LLFGGMRENRITVERYDGEWHNIGTPAQLAALGYTNDLRMAS
jgi:hypothetical protein